MKIKLSLFFAALIVLMMPATALAVPAEDDWESPNVIVSPTTTAGVSGDGQAEDVPTEEIVIDGADTVVDPTEGVIIGGWDSLTGVVDSISASEIWSGGVGDGVFFPGGWGMEGMDIEPTSGEAPSGIGLWWRGVKENVSLAFTFNNEKKAEKRLKFAEERMQQAGALAEQAASDPKVQKRVEQMVGQAQKHLDKIETTRDKWFDPNKEGAQRLVGNIARHTLNREAIMDQLEVSIPEDDLDNLRKLRQQGLEGSQRLMNAIENENIPTQIRQHLQDVRGHIELQAQEVRGFVDRKKELLDKRTAGDEGAGAQLDQLKNQWREGTQNRVEIRKEWRPGEEGSFFDVFRPNPTEGTEGSGVRPPIDREAASGLPTGRRQMEPDGIR